MQNKPEEAVTWYSAALEARPGWSAAQLGLAKANLSRRQPAQALKALGLITGDPSLVREITKLTGIARLMSGDPEGARPALEEYRRLSPPGDEDALRNLAALHAKTGDETAMAEVLEEMIPLRPQDNQLHLRLLQALAATGQLVRLNAALDRVETQWPGQADPLEACAAFYEATRQYALATRCAARARTLPVQADRHPRLTRWAAWL
jgi:tetratricopeptide (TPR) repeat protein